MTKPNWSTCSFKPFHNFPVGLLCCTLVPEVFFLFFFAKEIKSKARSGDNESRKRRGELEKPLVTLASNLTFIQTTGTGSDPRALIG